MEARLKRREDGYASFGKEERAIARYNCVCSGPRKYRADDEEDW
jgi:hypothetical protein